MKEQLITFETAKLAKEKGFPIIEKGFYIKGVFANRGFAKDFHKWYNDDPLIQSAPTQSLLQKWFREKHNIDIVIHHINDDKFESFIYKNIKHKKICYGVTYEEVLEKGLHEALKLI